MRVLEPHYAALDEELHVRAVSDTALGGNNALFGDAATKLGLESHRIKRYDAGCEGSAGCLTGCRGAKKLGMNITYVPRTLHAGGKIYSSAKVDRVESSGGRAVEVRATMKSEAGPIPLTVRARRGIFVAASAVQTPGVLRRSGLRAKAVGRHFQAHPGVSIMGALDRPVHMDFGAAQGFNSLAYLDSDRIKLESLSLPPELASARLPGVGPEMMRRFANYSHMAAWAVVIRSEAEGSVGEMFGNDQVRFSLTTRDMQNARKGLKTLCEMMFAMGAREVYPGAHGMPSVMTSPDQLKLWDDAPADSRAYTMMMSHMMGSARMGRDPRTSVVGTDFQSHEIQRLFVVDSSVFPTNLGVNPQHTIMAMARLCATRVAEKPALPF
jgi:choline dehydrogenase-like flavoprotein